MRINRSNLTDDFADDDAIAQQQLHRLHNLTVRLRWITVIVLWLTVAPLSLWALRSEIQLMREYFTWAALRYAIAFNSLPAIGLALCIGMTCSVLLWQSRNILIGPSKRHQRRLKQQLAEIRSRGPKHPLWKWVCQPGDRPSS